MDMEKLVAMITQEVIRRIEELQQDNSKRILVAAPSESEEYKYVENKLGSSQCIIDSLENIHEELDCYESIILCGIDNRELANLALGVECGLKERIAIKGILKGKRIFLIKEGIEYRKYSATANKLFFSLYRKYEKKLVSYGITLIQRENITQVLKEQNNINTCDGDCECKDMCETPLTSSSEIIDVNEKSFEKPNSNVYDFSEKRLISEADLRRLFTKGIREINVSKRTVLTPLSKDFIRIHDIKVNTLD